MKKLFKFFNAIQVKLYRLTKGKIGGNMRGFKVILLTITGRKSGKTYTTPLGGFDHGGSYIVVASNFGLPTQPAWYWNLRSNPHVIVEAMDKVIPATAEILSGEAHAEAWSQVISVAPMYANYEKRASREIPIILLHPN